VIARLSHLARRTWLSIVDASISADDRSHARATLTDVEFGLWAEMMPVDQRHSVRVLEAFVKLFPDASRNERAAVLLHDVGKSVAKLGTLSRIAATVGILRSARARNYLEHERIGLDISRKAGVDEAVIEMLGGGGTARFCEAMRRADDE